MAEQLSIFGLWERVQSEVLKEPAPPPPRAPAPIDPRQVDLLSGPQPLRAALEDACLALDASAVRRAHEELFRRFLGQGWAARAPEWAQSIEWLLGKGGEAPAAEEQAARAQAFLGEAGAARLPEAPGYLLEGLRLAAVRRAVERLVAERGVTARLSDGRPAGYLLLLAGDPRGARASLERACAAADLASAQWLGYLGEAAWRCGDVHAALEAYGLACLVDPLAVDSESITCRPVLDLIDLGDDLEIDPPVLGYLPVLADLHGTHPLDDRAIDLGREPTAARRLAGLLRRYRARRSAGTLDEAARIEAKREMLRLAPAGLRELFRRV